MHFIQREVGESTIWTQIQAEFTVTGLVHGAAITPSPEREASEPREILDINVMGTATALEWARLQPSLQRLVYVSSGAVYANKGPDAPFPEEEYVKLVELYAISTYTSEHIIRGYGEIFGIDVVAMRFSGLYGPMDRETPYRTCETSSVGHHTHCERRCKTTTCGYERIRSDSKKEI